jgi:hypothetical protein
MPCQSDGVHGDGGQGSGLGTTGIYPRVVKITRIAPLAVGGNVGYRSDARSNESVILTGAPASIDYVTRGPDPLAKVPGDTVGRGLWRIFMPSNVTTTGGVHLNDVATDDLGRRFKLNAPVWGGLDIQVEAELLRA